MTISTKLAEARFADLLRICDGIILRIPEAVSDRVCENVDELERYHDALALSVENLAHTLRETLEQLARDSAE